MSAHVHTDFQSNRIVWNEFVHKAARMLQKAATRSNPASALEGGYGIGLKCYSDTCDTWMECSWPPLYEYPFFFRIKKFQWVTKIK